MIKYTVSKNKLSTSASAPYLPKTLLEGSLSFEQFIKALAYGSTATVADVKAVLENLERVCIENLSQGRSVNLGFGIIKPIVKGSFQNPEDSFTAEKNRIEVRFSPNPTFQKKITLEAKVQRVAQNKTIPQLLSLQNQSSELEIAMISGHLLTLHGENMKFDKTAANLGLFFEKAGVELRVSEYSHISGKVISFKVPNGLVSGESYKLKLKSIFGQEVRTGDLDFEVNAA